MTQSRIVQHFDEIPDAEPGTEGNYGGSVSLADYCPYIQEFTWRYRSVAVRSSRCSFRDNNPSNGTFLPYAYSLSFINVPLSFQRWIKISHWKRTERSRNVSITPIKCGSRDRVDR